MAKALPAGRRGPSAGHVRAVRLGRLGVGDDEGLLLAPRDHHHALGYIPDRAYYFIVSRTIELGILGWSPVNLCPPENGTSMPCPVPAGAVLPWQASPAEAALPQPRTQGSAAQLGTNLLYIGGLDGADRPRATTYKATIDAGNVGAWSEGPALPEARTDAGIAILSGSAYLVGGIGPDGEPTDTRVVDRRSTPTAAS